MLALNNEQIDARARYVRNLTNVLNAVYWICSSVEMRFSGDFDGIRELPLAVTSFSFQHGFILCGISRNQVIWMVLIHGHVICRYGELIVLTQVDKKRLFCLQ